MKTFLFPRSFFCLVFSGLCFLAGALTSPIYAQGEGATPTYKKWTFKNLEEWTLQSQDENPEQQISLEAGNMRIFTRKGSVDRKKAAAKLSGFGAGSYKWRMYISRLGEGDQASIGAFIYKDDQHEIDFEVGYGKAAERTKYKAKKNEVLAYMTTQGNPFSSVAYPIKPGWHTFEIKLTLNDEGKYLVTWFIDGKQRHEVQQTFGDEVKFSVICSVENLGFIGDKPASQDNYGLFQWVEYTPTKTKKR